METCRYTREYFIAIKSNKNKLKARSNVGISEKKTTPNRELEVLQKIKLIS